MFVDFYKVPADYNSYNTIIIFVDRFGKRPISLPCRKNINAKGIARLYINYPYWIYRLLDTIVFN
jgi:hypothetical protein